MTAPRVVVAGGHSAGHIEPTMYRRAPSVRSRHRRRDPAVSGASDADVVLARHVLTAVAE
ncbi:hypothetical protein E1262_01960 [Jiangella aurantiaca]|uniref:Uncharacterized protein n=1 Tax=Jiangella aurantiaca TaxID=2530373 RepID=A0A4R5AIQ5_9ACTN|nr:hypothetical protein [Jiangella aurantiaca]TDD72648.1 hypothetical protein E1262_01960 [Jiangella aurantiaca]